MTAICGIWYRDGREADAACVRMRHALKIYGPHREGGWSGGDIALGADLYRTLPEDCFDRQPQADESGRFVVLADARIDNRPELAVDFGWSAERAGKTADVGFVLAAWCKWQEGAFDRLIGDWALAIWDRDTHRLTLARDALGIRPLFYHTGDGFFAFASMAKGLHALPDIPLAPDLDTLRDYLTLAPPDGPASFFRGICEVEPGAVVAVSADGQVHHSRWHDWDHLPPPPAMDEACIAEFTRLFDRAVADRLRGVGPVASTLSSGFDSTAVAVTAAQMLAHKGKRLTAYTHVPHPDWEQECPKMRCGDEGRVAAATAACFPNIDHVLVTSGERRFGDGLDDLFYYEEAPRLNLCNTVWDTEINRQACGHAILLTGEMGNAVISVEGYERLAMLIGAGKIGTWLREFCALLWKKKSGVRGNLYRSFAPWLTPRWRRMLGFLLHRRMRGIADFSAIHPAHLADGTLLARLSERGYDPSYPPRRSLRERHLYMLRRCRSYTLIAKAVLAQYGLERRDPTCDRRLVEFSLSLPAHMWLRGGVTKWLYRQAFAGRVPDGVLNCPLHGYQGADWPEQMRRSIGLLGDETERALACPDVAAMMDGDFLQNVVAEISSGDRPKEQVYRFRIRYLRALSVAHFIRKAQGRN